VAVKLAIQASASEYSRYRALVNSDWNGATYRDALRLLWDVVTISPGRSSGPADWLWSLKRSHGTTPEPLPEALDNVLAALISFFRDPHIPRKSNGQVARKSRPVIQAQTTAVSLLLQVICTITGETGFFRDLQSLLYLNSTVNRDGYAQPPLVHESVATESHE
jgi:hypothetical protein